MKIALLATQDIESPSGRGRYFPIATHLRYLGYKVDYIGLHPQYSQLPKNDFILENVQIRYVGQMHVKKNKGIKTYFPLLQLLYIVLNSTIALTTAALRSDADIIVVCKPHPMNFIAGILISRLTQTRLIVDIDDDEVGSNRFSHQWQKKLLGVFVKQVIISADVLVVNSISQYSSILNSNNLSNQNKIYYIPNGIDQNKFEPSTHVELADFKKSLSIFCENIIVYVGSLGLTNHAVDLLIEAVSHLSQERQDFLLLIVGGGEDFDTLHRYAERLGISHLVLFLGQVPQEVAKLCYQIAKISIDPCRDDDAHRGRVPLKLFESWALSVPFITSNVGDREMLLGTPLAGMLVPPDNPVEIARAIQFLLSTPTYCDQLQKRGLLRVKEFYWQTLIKQYITCLKTPSCQTTT